MLFVSIFYRTATSRFLFEAFYVRLTCRLFKYNVQWFTDSRGVAEQTKLMMFTVFFKMKLYFPSVERALNPSVLRPTPTLCIDEDIWRLSYSTPVTWLSGAKKLVRVLRAHVTFYRRHMFDRLLRTVSLVPLFIFLQKGKLHDTSSSQHLRPTEFTFQRSFELWIKGSLAFLNFF